MSYLSVPAVGIPLAVPDIVTTTTLRNSNRNERQSEENPFAWQDEETTEEEREESFNRDEPDDMLDEIDPVPPK